MKQMLCTGSDLRTKLCHTCTHGYQDAAHKRPPKPTGQPENALCPTCRGACLRIDKQGRYCPVCGHFLFWE